MSKTSTKDLPRILYVEDHFESSVILSRMLARDCQVDLAANQADALNKLTSGSYQAILLDINLGGDQTDGLTLLSKLRGLPGCANVPVLAVTAYALEGDREYFLEQGFTDYLSKPVSLPELREKLKAILKR